MSDHKRIELFTTSRPIDLVGPIGPVLEAGELRAESYLGDEGNQVSVFTFEQPMPGHLRFPFVVVNVDHQLSDSTPAELARLCADLAAQYILRPEVDGGLFEDPDLCVFLAWDRGAEVQVNSHPYVVGSVFWPAMVASLDRAGIHWVARDLGIRFHPRAYFFVRNAVAPLFQDLWSTELANGQRFVADVMAIASTLGVPGGIDRSSYEGFPVDRHDLVGLVLQVLTPQALEAGLVDRYRPTIVRLVAMALAAGVDLSGLDPAWAGLVAEARALG